MFETIFTPIILSRYSVPQSSSVASFKSFIIFIDFKSPLISTFFSLNAFTIIGKNSSATSSLMISFSSALHTDGLLVLALITMFLAISKSASLST